MSSLIQQIAGSASMARSVATATLLGAAFFASPLIAMRTDGATIAPVALVQATSRQATAGGAGSQGRSVEQWITKLHAALDITPAEEAKWSSVTQAMREHPAAVRMLAAGRIGHIPQGGSANLISSFKTLYNAMPDSQKKVALQLFQTLGHGGGIASHCGCVGVQPPNRTSSFMRLPKSQNTNY